MLPAIFTEEITDAALTLVVTAPAENAPTSSQRNRVMLPAGELPNFLFAFGPDNARRSAHVFLVTDPELTVVVQAPSEELAFRIFVK